MDVSPLLRSENQSPFVPDNSQRRLAHPIYGSMDHDPYAPLPYASPRFNSCTTVFLFALLVVGILHCFLTIEAVFYDQILFASGTTLLALTPIDNVVECKTWGRTAYPPSSIPGTTFLPWEVAEFDVPMDERDLFVLARGSSPSGITSRLAFLSTIATRGLSSARVCLVERGDLGHGVAILPQTPSGWILPKQKEKLFFVVNVTLSSHLDSVSHLPGFTIDVPEFALEVDDLSAFDFDSVTLKSTNSPITVKSIAGQAVIVEGKNGKISGSFNATRLLALTTTNAAIEASAQAHNASPGQPTVISLKTTNDALHANISLSSNASSSRGIFRVSTQTTNAPLSLSLSADEDARHILLHLDAATHNASAHVELPPAFEGRFQLRTTRFHPELREAPRVTGRVRRLSTSTVSGHTVIGNVSCVLTDGNGMHEHGPGNADGDAETGWASVSTRNAPATLVL
ncbi:hypothetical protein EI94DRAFT_1786630 [Lactarius quietus]|nr:hypothetical protein EI94DRAFT_1786630 [Lactarius quietus]